MGSDSTAIQCLLVLIIVSIVFLWRYIAQSREIMELETQCRKLRVEVEAWRNDYAQLQRSTAYLQDEIAELQEQFDEYHANGVTPKDCLIEGEME